MWRKEDGERDWRLEIGDWRLEIGDWRLAWRNLVGREHGQILWSTRDGVRSSFLLSTCRVPSV